MVPKPDGFIIQGDLGGDEGGDSRGDQAGWSVSSAGDVNGDGFDDLIVGAKFGDDGGRDAGEAYVVFGKALGFGTEVTIDDVPRQVLDLSNLLESEGFIIQGDAAGDQAGFSVSSAGDVNGDGYDDLIVGAPYGDDDGGSAGEAYVVFGGAFGADGAPVTTTGTAGNTAREVLRGGRGDDVLTGNGGLDVFRSGAGDDTLGISDTAFARIDGGHGMDTLRLDGSGIALDFTAILPSKVDSIERIDLTGTGDNTLRLTLLDLLDLSDDTAGGITTLTVLGDAGDRVTVTDAGWTRAADTVEIDGQSFARFDNGNARLLVDTDVTVAIVFDLTTLSAADGFVIQGDAGGDQAGWSVSSAGDVNGDGFDDLIVGAPRGDDGDGDAGEAYVVFGTASGFGTVVTTGTGDTAVSRRVLDLTALPADDGFIIQGDAGGDQAGFSVSSAGDVNGDGYDDLIVGAPYGGGIDAGEAYVVFGRASGFGTIDLTTLSAADGFVIQGDAGGDRAGRSVSSAGDVNGDGFDDLIVGAPYGSDGGPDAGEAYVVFGKASGFGTIDLTTLSAADGFIIQGDAAGGWAGFSVSSVGDVNGDGYDDLIVGAPYGDDGGEAYVVFGKASGFGTIDLTTLSQTDGFIIQGDVGGDEAGFSVSSAGDVNGDGFDDLIVGAPYGADGAGEAYVVFGTASGFGTEVTTGTGADAVSRRVIDLTTLPAADGFIIQGDAGADRAGWSVSSAGDVNGDGFDDLIVGAPFGYDGGAFAGEAYVVFGKASGFGTIDLSHLPADDGFIIQGDAGSDQAGRSVSSAGDVNHDGYDDLIVGAPFGDDGDASAGEAYVVFGGAFGTDGAPVTTTGTANNTTREVLRGGRGDDVLTGGGGLDIFRSGAGDDVLGISDTAFARIDGGTGEDTLRLDGSGITLDFTAILPAKVDSIERIDLTGTGDNSLTLDIRDLLDLSDDTAGGVTTLTVLGDAGDRVTTADAGWTRAAETVEIDGQSFVQFDNGNARLLVDANVTVDGVQV